jgi:hypothetical protein
LVAAIVELIETTRDEWVIEGANLYETDMDRGRAGRDVDAVVGERCRCGGEGEMSMRW